MRRVIPLADLAALTAPGRRTTLVRLALTFAVAGAAAAAALGAPGSGKPRSVLPTGSSPIVVVDVSWSVSSDSYRQIHATLRELAASQRQLGLVLFSDVAYEALPPGTPSSELRPLLRFFDQRGRTPPPNPWSGALSGGTRIWTGLALARDMLRRDHVHDGSVVLISDLADAPNDRALLAETIVSYVSESIPLRVVALNATREDERLFEGFLGQPGALVHVERARSEARVVPLEGRFPVALVAAVAALLLVLAVGEWSLGSLVWRRGSTS